MNKIVVACVGGVMFGFAINAALDLAISVEALARHTIAGLAALFVGGLGWAFAKSVRTRA